MSRPSRRAEITQRVFDSALNLILKRGFHNCSMSKLAKLSEVSVASIYLYFPSKEELMRALHEYVRQNLKDDFLKDYSPQLDIQKRFETLFLNICNAYLNNKAYFVYMDQFALSVGHEAAVQVFADESQKAFMDFHRDGISANELSEIPFELMSVLVYGPINTLMRHHCMGLVKVNQGMLQVLKESVWQSIKLHK